MANVFKKPITLTTTMSQDYWSTIGVPAGQGKPLLVKSIIWSAPGASANLVIQDTFGNVLFQASTPASFAGSDPEYLFDPPRKWRNFQATTLSAGTVEIDFD